jgi:hypothetical protein
MPYIPHEILDKIIACAIDDGPYYFSNSASFISLTSHTFHRIVLPYKFRSVTFRNRNREDIYDDTVIPIPEFCEAINAGDAYALSLAPLVQELSLLLWSGKDGIGNDLITKPFEKIINGVLSFRNLTKLSMQKYVLPHPPSWNN